MMKLHCSQISIDVDALQHNFKRLKIIAPNSRILAMLKANAYGHGLLRVAQALPQADAFGVACLVEGIKLRQADILQRIVVMRGVLNEEELLIANQYQLDIVIHQFKQISLLEQQQLQFPLNIWLKINTGMNRLGFMPHEVSEAYERLMSLNNINKPLHFITHFACSDEIMRPAITREQFELFNHATVNMLGYKSLANSAAILSWPETHADWIRPGLMLYGISPFPTKCGAEQMLEPVMTWSSNLIAIRHQRKGDYIGYGGDYVCPEDMLIGVVGIGYGDGYPRHAKTGAPVLVNGQRVQLVGRVSMDMLMVDLHTQPRAKIGDPVILWGKDLPIEEVAQHTASNVYELVCSVHTRY